MDKLLLNQKGNDPNYWLELTEQGGLLNENECRTVCERVKEIIIEESNVIPVDAPVTVIGSVVGNFLNLLKII